MVSAEKGAEGLNVTAPLAPMVPRFTKGNIQPCRVGNMVDLKSWAGPFIVAFLVVSVGYVVANPLSPNAPDLQGSLSTTKYSVNLATSVNLGTYLVNGTGFTLYYYDKDSANGTSACYGGCVTFWPLFYAGDKLTLPPGLRASSFGDAIRTDGHEQSTFDGHPLYYFVKDTAPGQITGQGDHGFYVCCASLNASTGSSPA